MMTNKGDVEEKLVCPYDKSHHILKHRMQTHLVKCQRNWPNVKIATCTFNAVHRVAEPELKYHLSVCPDRLGLDKHVYKSENVQGAEVLYPIPVLNLKPEAYWDDQEDVPTYNPEEHCKNNPILRNSIHTKSAAVRRNFRMEERARAQQFDDAPTISNNQPLGGDALQKPRRPTGQSAAIRNKVDKLGVCDIMEELTLNDGVLTTPKVPVTSQKSMPAADIKNDLEADYPALANDYSNNSQPRTAPWSASTLAMKGMGSTYRSRGRGSNLAKKD